jgi:N-acetylmuramoyl-L-alanine amidase
VKAFLKHIFLLLLIETILFGAQNRIVNVQVNDFAVIVEFSSPPKLDQIKQNTLDDPKGKSKYRQYFDLSAVLAIKAQVFKKNKLFDEMRISQFDKDSVRLVVLLDRKDKFDYKIDDKKVIFESQNSGAKEEKSSENEVKKDLSAKAVLNDLNLELETKPTSPQKDSAQTVSPSINSDGRKKIIVLDPGHGGKDSGAIGIKSKMEKDVVLALAEVTKGLLEKRGYEVLMTRNNDYFVELQDRTKFADSKGADLFLSIHANAVDLRHSDPGKAKGIETFFLSPARSDRAKRVAQIENGPSMDLMDSLSKGTFLTVLNREKIVASNKFAIDIHRAVLTNLRAKYKDEVDGGVREAPFWVLVGAQMPAVLIEIGYITNPEEGQRLDNPVFRALFARGLAEGIDRYFENN